MEKKILYILTFLFFINCSTRKNIEIKQEYLLQKPIDITFFLKKGRINNGVIVLKNKIILENKNLNLVNIDFYYFRNGDTIYFPNEAILTTMTDKEYFKKTGKRNRIKISPFGKVEIEYLVWNNIDTLDFTNRYYKSLEQYKNLVKPTDMSSVMPNSPNSIDKNILSYEEPFSEFKRKNPELLEFLTKGDSIELEVISPVKQKYKFKAEW